MFGEELIMEEDNTGKTVEHLKLIKHFREL